MNEPNQPPSAEPKAFPISVLVYWLNEQLSFAAKALRAREQMQEAWREGTDKSWQLAAMMHPSTAGEPPMSKADRLRESATHGRIAAKCRLDVEMFKAVISELSRRAPQPETAPVPDVEAIHRSRVNIRAALKTLETVGCTCYSDPEGGCKYCNAMDAIYKEVYEPSEEEINREVAGIDIGKMADAVRDRIAQSRKRLREDELRLNASECPFCKGQSEAIRSKCTHNPFDLI